LRLQQYAGRILQYAEGVTLRPKVDYLRGIERFMEWAYDLWMLVLAE